MTLQSSVYLAISLDGFIARIDGGLDWLDAAGTAVPEGEELGFSEFMETIDALVMGRLTYEKVRSFGQWPYGDTQVIVMSSKPVDIPAGLVATVSSSSEPPQVLCKQLAAAGHKRLYVDGGNTITRFMDAGLISDITITIIPVILGNGTLLAAGLAQDVLLKHVETKSYEFGFVQIMYKVDPQCSLAQPSG